MFSNTIFPIKAGITVHFGFQQFFDMPTLHPSAFQLHGGRVLIPITSACSLSRGGKGGYLSGENGDVYVVGV